MSKIIKIKCPYLKYREEYPVNDTVNVNVIEMPDAILICDEKKSTIEVRCANLIIPVDASGIKKELGNLCSRMSQRFCPFIKE
ncbi:MAG: hypothetical protein WC872_00370 [Candidatus Absconditabacterales bacterium]|jgi:hypothetical protein